MYKYFIKPLLFQLDPEKAHYFTVKALSFILSIPGIKSVFKLLYHSSEKSLERNVFGLNFKNPIGLAAGFDKDGKYYESMSHLGFGFVEIGTVTPLAQDGNPKPRLFRLPADQGLINRMGFNNDGMDAMVERLKKRIKSDLIVGGNIGKNKATSNESATDDYVKSFNALFPYVDYFVVNVSSPNTPGLRELQEKEPLTKLLSTLQEINNKQERRKPLLLKIAPDLNHDQLDDIIEIADATALDGIIASNTTISRADLATESSVIEMIGNGGLSGKPVGDKSTEIIRYIYEKTSGKLPIIGVGGIHSYADAKDKLDAGASLIQIYSGLVYEGPALVRKINKQLSN